MNGDSPTESWRSGVGVMLIRRCYSEDHRGTPEAPGRVVTLIDKAHWETLTDSVSYRSLAFDLRDLQLYAQICLCKKAWY